MVEQPEVPNSLSVPEGRVEPELSAELRTILETLVTRGRVLVVTDLDGTTVPYRADPNECAVDPVAHAALERLIQARMPVAALTARGAHSAQALLKLEGAMIVGSNGTEWSDGQTMTLSPELAVHAADISVALGRIAADFETFLQKESQLVGDQTPQTVDYETLTTSDGPLFVGHQGQSQTIPHGVALEYNFNLYDQEETGKRARLIEQLAAAYERHMPEALKPLIGCERTSRNIKVSPLVTSPKWRSLAQLIRREAERPGEPLASVIYLGDTNSDAKAVRMMSLVSRLTQLDARGAVVLHDAHAQRFELPQDRAIQVATIHLDGIGSNAQALAFLADCVQRRRGAASGET